MDEKIDTAIVDYIRRDPYARFLGIEIDEIRSGFARVSMKIDAQHTNFHGTVHGGMIFTLADVAFSAACNSHGQTAVGLNVDISYVEAAQAGDVLQAEAEELSVKGPIGLYQITVRNGGSSIIAQCQAMAYRKRDRFIDSV